MKTQIICRTFLIAVLIFISYSNKGDNAKTNMPSSSITILKTSSSNIKKTFEAIASSSSENSASVSCIFCAHAHEYPAIPEPNGDHEFHSFHVKDKHHKSISFWKSIANKLREVVYYVIILIVYLPFKH